MILGVLSAVAALIVVFLVLAVIVSVREQNAKAARLQAMSPEERQEHIAAEATIKKMLEREKREKDNASSPAAKLPKPLASPLVMNQEVTTSNPPGNWFLHGNSNPAMICPHCNTKGFMRVRRVSKKKGISGGKATAAIITGGVSILATGLSRRERLTDAYCGNCNNKWTF
jgi:hypothetical protein